MIPDFYKKLSDKEKKFFNITVIIVSLALLDRLFLGPVLDRLETIDDKISQQVNIIKRDQRILEHKDRILESSQLYSDYFTEDMKDDDVINAQFLRTIERLATKTAVNLIKSNPSHSTKERNFQKYYANLDLTGPLENVVEFMHAVNSSEELLKIVRFTMSPKRGEDENAVNASMTIVKLIVYPESIMASAQAE